MSKLCTGASFQQLSQETVCILLSFLEIGCKLNILEILIKDKEQFIEFIKKSGDCEIAAIDESATFIKYGCHRLFYIAQKLTFSDISKNAKINWSLYPFDANKIVHILANAGELEMLQTWSNKQHSFPILGAYHGAISGQIQVLDWLYGKYGLNYIKIDLNFGVFYQKLRPQKDKNINVDKYMQALKWYIDHGLPLTIAIFDGAINICNIDIIKWLIVHNCPYNESVFHKSAFVGNLEILQFFHSVGMSFIDNFDTANEIAKRLARNGHLDCLQWWYSICPAVFTDSVFTSAIDGGLHMLQWLAQLPEYYTHNSIDLNCYEIAIGRIFYLKENFDINILNWLFETGHNSLNGEQFIYAGHYGSVEVLDWLLVHGCEYDIDDLKELSVSASRMGNLNVLKWMIKNNFNLDITICAISASDGCDIGGLSVFDWIITEYANSWDSTIYLENIKEEIDNDDISFAESVVIFGKLNIVQWFFEKECSFDIYTCILYSIAYGHFDILLWLLSHDRENISWDIEFTGKAVKNGHLNILKLLIESGCPYNIADCIQIAKKKKYFHILEWLSFF